MITKETLEKLYLTEEKSMKECAKELGVAVGTIFNYLKRCGIKSRPKMTDKIRQKISDSKIGKPSKRKGYKLSAARKMEKDKGELI